MNYAAASYGRRPVDSTVMCARASYTLSNQTARTRIVTFMRSRTRPCICNTVICQSSATPLRFYTRPFGSLLHVTLCRDFRGVLVYRQCVLERTREDSMQFPMYSRVQCVRRCLASFSLITVRVSAHCDEQQARNIAYTIPGEDVARIRWYWKRGMCADDALLSITKCND